MKESLFEDILAKYPQLIEPGLVLEGRQVTIHGRRMDLVFKDTLGRQLIVELKAGPIKDEHIGQIMSYEGSLLSHGNPDLRIMLIGTRVPPNIQRSLDHHGIAWKEITYSVLQKHLQSIGDEGLLGSCKEDQQLTKTSILPRVNREGIRSFPNKLEFDQNSLDALWEQAVSFDSGTRDLKFIKDHLGFYRDLTDRVLRIDPSVRVRINRSQYAFYDGLDIGPFCSFVFFKSKFSLNPQRLKPENVKDLGCELFSFEGKKYRMGGTFYVQFHNWDDNDLVKALDVAKRSFAVKKKVGPAPFFQDQKKSK